MDPAFVSVLGVVKDRQDLNSKEASSTPGVKAKKTQSSEESSSSNAKDKKTYSKDKGKAVKKHVSPARVAKPSTDSKLDELDQIWFKRFTRLEAMLLSKSFNQPGPVFQPVVVSPAKPPSDSTVDNTQQFFESQPTDRLTTTHQQTDHCSSTTETY